MIMNNSYSVSGKVRSRFDDDSIPWSNMKLCTPHSFDYFQTLSQGMSLPIKCDLQWSVSSYKFVIPRYDLPEILLNGKWFFMENITSLVRWLILRSQNWLACHKVLESFSLQVLLSEHFLLVHFCVDKCLFGDGQPCMMSWDMKDYYRLSNRCRQFPLHVLK